MLAGAALNGCARGRGLDGDGGAVLADLHEEHPGRQTERKEERKERKEGKMKGKKGKMKNERKKGMTGGRRR